MTFKNQLLFWLGTFLIVILFLFIFRAILLPFVAGMVLAYCLDPIADWLEKFGIRRILATVIILLFAIMLFTLVLIIIIPLIIAQITNLIQQLPNFVSQIQELVSNQSWLNNYLVHNQNELQQSISSLLQNGAGWITTLLKSIWSGSRAFFDILSLFIVTPVVAFYLLYDWDKMIEKIDNWLPREHADTIRNLLSQIDKALAGFMRGQGLVSLLLGTFYAISLSIAGLNYGLLIGLFAGLISFIPYVGSILGFIISIGVALAQFWPDYLQIGIIGLIFVIGQFVEGNFLQPRLVGSSVGLHPVWLMFALFAFGSLFGFVGLLIAVPVAAALGVLVRFAIQKYLHSPYYKGYNLGQSDKINE